jgi:hypothetical protein
MAIAGGAVGVSLAGESGVAGISVGMLVGTTVAVGLGRSTYAHRFSCVGVGEANNISMAALAGEVPVKKMNSPAPVHKSNSHRLARRRTRLVGSRVLMGSY